VLLEVTDTGVGIPEEEFSRIFERFHRTVQAEGRTQGTGIGLALVRELVELHGGHITVESQVDRGTTFRVSIPKGYAHLPPDAVLQEPAPAHHSTGPILYAADVARSVSRWMKPDHAAATAVDRGPGTRPRVLVVDDNADLRDYVTDLLAPSYDVITAPDGLAALDLVRERQPDLVVSDVMMPRLDGFGLVRELRSEPATAALPVILLSARAGEEAAIQGLASGSDDYLAKPFSARELLARVRTHVELARVRREWVAQLEQMNRELEAANTELEAFASSVSHDLRGPLTAIKGFSTLVVQDHAAEIPPDALELLEDVRTAANRMEQLIDDLLRFARLARQPLAKQSVDVNDIVRSVLIEVSREHTGRDVDVQVDPLPQVVADPSLLTQVFANLLSNAFKFTRHKQRATIEIGSRRGDGANVFFVRDNGAGFNMRHASRLFGILQRLHTQDEFAGTGVGLSLVHRIVKRHGGEISAQGKVDNGATFQFSIPG
jgi:signal transduction histidine kinase